MVLSDSLLIVAISLFTAFLGEGVTWMLVYRTEKYQKLKSEIEKQTKKCKSLMNYGQFIQALMKSKYFSGKEERSPWGGFRQTAKEKNRTGRGKIEEQQPRFIFGKNEIHVSWSTTDPIAVITSHFVLLQVLHWFRIHSSSLNVQLNFWWESCCYLTFHSFFLHSRFVTSQSTRNWLHWVLFHLPVHLVYHVDSSKRSENARFLPIKGS